MFDLNIGTIEHGWVDISIVLNSKDFLLVFEYTPNDGLDDLLKSGIQLVLYGDSSIIDFPNGTHREYLSVEKTNDDKCTITIGEYSSEIPIKQYVRTILKMFDKYTHVDSKQGYAEKWRHAFPEKSLELLRTLYHTKI